MEHRLKYYKEIESHGHLWRLEFLQETEETLAPMEIGPVLQGLRLVMQGDQADIDTPIVKTSLEMSFIDAPDLEDERKCGYWEEFYTSSATEYMVCLYKDGEKEWSGYVTPDSFAEDLRYRSSISIIARDNLGILQDLDCDPLIRDNYADKSRIIYLITRAMERSGCAMEFVFDESDYMKLPYSYETTGLLEMSGNVAYNCIDAVKLRAMNWYDVLEKVLYAIGAVLRYIGKNKFAVIALRDLPKWGKEEWWDVPLREVNFIAYGRRELVPGVREIVETQKYSIEVPNDSLPALKYDAGVSGFVMQGNIWLAHKNAPSISSQDIDTYGYYNPMNGITVSGRNTPLLNAAIYPRVKGESSERYGSWDNANILYYAVNVSHQSDPSYRIDCPVKISRSVFTNAGTANITFTLDKPVSLTTDINNKSVMNTPIDSASEWGENPLVKFYIKFEDFASNKVLYYTPSDGWKENANYITYNISTSLFTTDVPNPTTYTAKNIPIPGAGLLSLEILRIQIKTLTIYTRIPAVGMYMRIRNIGINLSLTNNETLLEKLTLITKNNEKYATRLTRNPEFAINETTQPEVAYMPEAIVFQKNKQTYYGVGDWSFPGRGIRGEGISLSRLIHQQLLAYYAKPNNLLSGELILKDNNIGFDGIWVWNNTPHLLTSGTLNILTGRIEGAILREYKRYDHLWETWADKEEIHIDYAESTETITVATLNNKELTADMFASLPSWVTISSITQDAADRYIAVLHFMENISGEERSAIITIDRTARIRIVQNAAGDYGTDYGKDYS